MLRKRGLKGGFYYYDAITNDARLTNEVIMHGCRNGGLALNYVHARINRNEDGSVSHLDCRDELSGETFQVKADQYVSAAGPWTDDVLAQKGAAIMKPSKGVHIVVDGRRFPAKDVLLIPCTDDRFIWICPWENGLVIIGATDTPFDGTADNVGVSRDDIDYLISNCNNYLEGFQLTEEDILSAYSGLRPLLNDDEEEDTVKVSRDYKVWREGSNLLVIAGGKLTSFFSMADTVMKELGGSKQEIDTMPEDSEIIDAIKKEHAANTELLTDRYPFTRALVIYFTRHQHARCIGDVLTRRLSLTYGMKTIDEDLVRKVGEAMATELNWSPDDLQDQLHNFREEWGELHTYSNKINQTESLSQS